MLKGIFWKQYSLMLCFKQKRACSKAAVYSCCLPALRFLQVGRKPVIRKARIPLPNSLSGSAREARELEQKTK